MTPVDLAIIGCGAITQKGYLPALASATGVRCWWLVDANRSLAEELARRWKVAGSAEEFRTVLDNVEAVVIATPNHLHAPMALEALARKKAVLCEKPLGRSSQEAGQMIEAARRASAPLIAGMTLRQYPGLQALQAAFPWEALGAIRHIRARYGNPLDWPLASPYLFDKEKVGGGALLDQGVHLLDALLWALRVEQASVVEAADDGASGMEADVQARLLLRLPQGRGEVPCTVEVSRLRRLANRIDVAGERASLVIPLSSTALPFFQNGGEQPAVAAHVKPIGNTRCFAEQLNAFARRVRGMPSVCAEGDSQLRVLELIEACYRARQPLRHPWEAYEPWPER